MKNWKFFRYRAPLAPRDGFRGVRLGGILQRRQMDKMEEDQIWDIYYLSASGQCMTRKLGARWWSLMMMTFSLRVFILQLSSL